ncbi:MAG: S10 family peptidase [Bryobacteraceae bacterium]
MMRTPSRVLAFLLMALCGAAAQEKDAAKPAPPAKPESETAAKAEPAPVVRAHEITILGQTLHYKTTAGRMPIRNAAGETEAQMFYTAYTLEGVSDAAKRRLVFAYNGGPGSSAVWLQMGAIGPLRVKLNDDGSLPAPPYKMVPNEGTWLDQADLVFIDPVGTGYSRATKPEMNKKFFSLKGDIESVGEFIRMYLTRNNRWLSPLLLAGESYGTTRSAGLAGYLVERGIALNGICLISTVLNFGTLEFDHFNDLAYELILPSYTAAAWYHKKLPADLQSDLKRALKESESYAAEGYPKALQAGDRLGAAERRAAVAKLARLTGLAPEFIDRAELRVDLERFQRELLRDRNVVIGRLDSRLTGPGKRALSLEPEFDPAMTTIRPPYTAAWYNYVRAELGYESDDDYYILGGGVRGWDYASDNHYADVTDALRQAFEKNPYMKLYVGAGHFDMATPYFAAWYTLDHMALPEAAKANIRRCEYESGHMYYINVESLRAMKRDVASFLEWAAPQ